METKNIFPLGLTFDDILLLPGFSDFSRSNIDLTTRLSRNIEIKNPLISAPMDTVTESKLAIELGKLGGFGFIHRNLTIDHQVKEVRKVRAQKILVGAAVGASSGFEERVKALVKAGVNAILVDSAHGFAKNVIETTKFIKKNYPKIDVIAGSIATADGAKALIDAGADGLRVGMGPGAICTTRIISGMGVPQITALMDVLSVAKKAKVPVIADGGIKYSGDMVKALAVGASTVMMGSFFAAAEEAPGKIVELRKTQVPHRFQSIFGKNKSLPAKAKFGSKALTVSPNLEKIATEEVYKFKEYRGMGSIGAMKKGVKIKSEDEFHGKSYKDRVLVAEGVEGLVPVKGKVKDLVDQSIGGIKSGMFYVGSRNMEELWQKAKFIQITQASLTESHPHDVLITNAGENY